MRKSNPKPPQCPPTISYSTLGFADRDMARALAALAAAGFQHTEICMLDTDAPGPPSGQALRSLRDGLRRQGVGAASVHAPMGRNVLGAPEESWRRDKVAVLAAHIRFAASLEAATVVIHPIPNPMFVPEPAHPQIPELIAVATRRSLDALVPVAAAAGVRILLENLPYACAYPFRNMDQLRTLVDPYPEAALGLVVDTGHAWTNGCDPAAEIRTAGERLGGTHLQDVDGETPQDDHWVPGQGGLDWCAIRAALIQVGYRGAWTFEVAHGRHGETSAELAALTRRFAAGWEAACADAEAD